MPWCHPQGLTTSALAKLSLRVAQEDLPLDYMYSKVQVRKFDQFQFTIQAEKRE